MSAIGVIQEDAVAIFKAAVDAAQPGRLVRQALTDVSYPSFKRIFVLALGKASDEMARAAVDALDTCVTGGWVISHQPPKAPFDSRFTWFTAGHPIPDEMGMKAAARVLEDVALLKADDCLICLISGGGSALTPQPPPGVTLKDKQAVTRLLLACGAAIHEINGVRKHLSRFKGGQLARAAWPAGVLSLILSDVIGDPLDAIASGPTAPDETTFGQAVAVLKRYSIWDQTPSSVQRHLMAGVQGRMAETPKSGDVLFQNVENRIIGSNRLALEAAAHRARQLGYLPRILCTDLAGEARGAAIKLVKQIGKPGQKVPLCFLAGGETTVTVTGTGRGGRNQEMALAAALALQGMEGTVFLSAGTDGRDGPTDAAGAVADGDTCDRGRSMGVSPEAYLSNNDAYTFFKELNDLIITGPTGTNVMDIQVMLKK